MKDAMKKTVLLFAVVIMSMMFSMSVSADMGLFEVEPAGQCGDNAYWTYDSMTGKLVITGEGTIDLYSFLSSSIKELVIEEGITDIGCFSFCDNLISVKIPSSITKINKYAFYSCDNLKSITIPDSVTYIAEEAFCWCPNLIDVYYSGTAEQWEEISILNGNNDLLNAFIHTKKEIPAIAPTCTTAGRTAGAMCLLCGKILVDSEYVPATGHMANNEVAWRVTKAATCTTDGEKTASCIKCGETITKSILATGHTEAVYKPAVAPTCTDVGYTESKYCIVCKTITVKAEIIEKTHSCLEWLEIKASSCKSAGVAESICSICGEKQIKTIDRLPHTEVTIYGTPADCISSGVKDGKECIICNAITVEQVEDPALGHDFVIDESNSVSATCTTKGYSYLKCSRCSAVEKRETLYKHNWGEWVVATQSSCDSQGEKYRKCTLCNVSDIKIIPSLGGHEVLTLPGFDATCTRRGRTCGSYCQKCNMIFDEQEIIPAKGHNWEEPTQIPPTCTKIGFWGTECQICDTVWEYELPALGHKDDNGDYKCDYGCDYEFDRPAAPSDPTDNCSCNCHKSGFMGFIWKITLFFNKLFKTNKTCACGVAHY